MINISIIIPHYNSTDRLIRLLHSIPNDASFEILIIDDKSTHDLAIIKKKLETLNRPHLYFIENKSDKKGAGVCRNIGLERAQGKWVLFADADDYFTDEFASVIDKYINSNYDVVFFKPTSIYEDTKQLANRHVEYEKRIDDYINHFDQASELFLRYKYKVPWSKLISLDFIKQYQIFFDEVIASNDVMFSTKVGYYMRHFIGVDETIYCVSQSIGSLTKKMNREVFNSRVNVFIDYSNFLKEHLSARDYNLLDIHGRYYLTKAVIFRLSPIVMIKTYIKFRRNKIKVFDLWLLNPVKMTKKIKEKKQQYNRDKSYYRSE